MSGRAGAGTGRGLRGGVMGRRISRAHYAELFGPTTGDRVRLGDTELWAEVERDLLVPGDECVFGGGKTLRDGLARTARSPPRAAHWTSSSRTCS